MIPYFEVPPLQLPGGITLQPFGAMIVIGVVAIALYARSRARELGIRSADMMAAFRWGIGSGLLFAHVGELVFYQPEVLAREGPRALLDVSRGLSAFGGIAGGTAILALYLRARGKSFLQYFDIIFESTFFGFIFFRVGCSLVHDHPGALSDFWLAVQYPGGSRHDLGFYELIFLVAAFLPTIRTVHARWPATGVRTMVASLLYGAYRFLFDFLRATDLPGSEPRYLGLTPGQYGAAALVGIGLWLWFRLRAGEARA